jgi:hypothetical protein
LWPSCSTGKRCARAWLRGQSRFARPLKVFWLDVRTGRKEPWRELMPADPAGITTIGRIAATPDGKSYASSYIRSLADLCVVEGLR